MTPPELRPVLHLDVEVGAAVEVGRTSAGLRRLVPITGGTASGALLQGRIVPGGWNDQLVRSETETEVEARYLVETDRGELVYVTSRGLRTGTADDVARLFVGVGTRHPRSVVFDFFEVL